MNAFVIAGGVLAGWAVLIGLLGLRGFPSNKGGEMAIVGITGLLFLGAVGSALGDQTKVGERKGKHTEEHEGEGADKGGEAAEPGGQQSPDEEPAPAASPAPEPETTEDAGADGTVLEISADPTGGLAFDTDSLEAEAGTVKIAMVNPSPVPHNVAIRGDGVDEKGEVVEKDGVSEVDADLKPGDYEFICTVPGHEPAGMKGTLTVK